MAPEISNAFDRSVEPCAPARPETRSTSSSREDARQDGDPGRTSGADLRYGNRRSRRTFGSANPVL